jgi:hypothetical protein
MNRLCTLAVIIGSICVPADAVGQQVRSRPITEVRSSGPALRLTEVVRLGSLDGAHDAFGRVMDVALSRSGRIFVADDQNHHVVAFGSNGGYVGTIGRRGQGPGEFVSPWKVAVDAQDSVFIWDAGLARISVFGPDLRFKRSFSVPPQWLINSIQFVQNGQLLVAAYGRNEPGSLHLLSRSGRLNRTFGPRFNSPPLSGFEASLLGGSADVAGGTIAYSTKSPYEIWFLDLAGRTQTRCVGRKEWTTEPSQAIRVNQNAAALQWGKYVHSSAILSLGGGLYLNQVLDPAGDRSRLDLVTADCRLLRRTTFNSPLHVVDASGSKLAAVRNLEFPEVLVYDVGIAK